MFAEISAPPSSTGSLFQLSLPKNSVFFEFWGLLELWGGPHVQKFLVTHFGGILAEKQHLLFLLPKKLTILWYLKKNGTTNENWVLEAEISMDDLFLASLQHPMICDSQWDYSKRIPLPRGVSKHRRRQLRLHFKRFWNDCLIISDWSSFAFSAFNLNASISAFKVLMLSTQSTNFFFSSSSFPKQT